MNSCPICRVIEGKRPGNGKICQSCKEIDGLELAYGEYSAYEMVRSSVFLMTLYFPMMLIIAIVVLSIQSKFNWFSVIAQLVSWATWFLTVFYLYPKLGVPRFGKWQKMEDAKDRLFITKLSGRRVEKGVT